MNSSPRRVQFPADEPQPVRAVESFPSEEESPLKDRNIMDETFHRDNNVIGGKFTLADQMLSKKQVNRQKEDIKKIKMLLSDMQVHVGEHSVKMVNMVNEEKLQVALELLEKQVQSRISKEIDTFENHIKPKIKKRMKQKTFEKILSDKVGEREFFKHMDKLNTSIQLVENAIEFRLPALSYEFNRALQNKADIAAVEAQLEKKADKSYLEEVFVERLNKLEEQTAKITTMVGADHEHHEHYDEHDEEVSGDDGASQGGVSDGIKSVKKAKRGPLMGSPGMPGGGGQGGINREAVEELKRKIEALEEKISEQISNVQTQTTQSIDDLKKQMSDSKFEMKRMESEMEELEGKITEAILDKINTTDNKDISEAQALHNANTSERLENLDREVERLQRLDFRLNKELVSKPYQYIDKVREALEKEQRDIVANVKANNNRYLSKITSLEASMNKVIQDTELILNMYKKKIGSIKSDLESITRFKNFINVGMKNLEAGLSKLDKTQRENQISTKEHIDRLALRYLEEVTDLKASSEGFSRELERVTQLFRELQTEFLLTLEEKKLNNETILKGAKLSAKEIKLAKKQAQDEKDKSLAVLLPKLKKTHELSNASIQNRQERLIQILKGTRHNSRSNSPSSRKDFASELKLSNLNKDLGKISSKQYLGSNGTIDAQPAFLTSLTPVKSRQSNYLNSEVQGLSKDPSFVRAGGLGEKKFSHNPTMPTMDYLSKKQEVLSQARGSLPRSINEKDPKLSSIVSSVGSVKKHKRNFSGHPLFTPQTGPKRQNAQMTERVKGLLGESSRVLDLPTEKDVDEIEIGDELA